MIFVLAFSHLQVQLLLRVQVFDMYRLPQANFSLHIQKGAFHYLHCAKGVVICHQGGLNYMKSFHHSILSYLLIRTPIYLF